MLAVFCPRLHFAKMAFRRSKSAIGDERQSASDHKPADGHQQKDLWIGTFSHLLPSPCASVLTFCVAVPGSSASISNSIALVVDTIFSLVDLRATFPSSSKL